MRQYNMSLNAEVYNQYHMQNVSTGQYVASWHHGGLTKYIMDQIREWEKNGEEIPLHVPCEVAENVHTVFGVKYTGIRLESQNA